jgi:hypothetical protein
MYGFRIVQFNFDGRISMSKKLLTILFATLLALAFAACAEDDAEEEEGSLDCGCECQDCLKAEDCDGSLCGSGCTCDCHPKAPILAFPNSDFDGASFFSTWIDDDRGIGGIALSSGNYDGGSGKFLAIVGGPAASSGKLFGAVMADNEGRTQLTFYIKTGGIPSKPLALIFSAANTTPASFTSNAPGIVLEGNLAVTSIAIELSGPISFGGTDINNIPSWKKIKVNMPKDFSTKGKTFALHVVNGSYSLHIDEIRFEDPLYSP